MHGAERRERLRRHAAELLRRVRGRGVRRWRRDDDEHGGDDHEHGADRHDHHDEHDQHDGHDGHVDHDEHDQHDGHDGHVDHDEHDQHDGHDGHVDHDEHDQHDGHDGHDNQHEHDQHDGHDGHDDHHEHHHHDGVVVQLRGRSAVPGLVHDGGWLRHLWPSRLGHERELLVTELRRALLRRCGRWGAAALHRPRPGEVVQQGGVHRDGDHPEWYLAHRGGRQSLLGRHESPQRLHDGRRLP